ncbi:sensor histidine kinase [Pedobacter nyackensis]|uniref:sensor histidine kinase n=1 Tax=Pedobacter nyackensis TaxID=475255 RepID=UPI0029303A41|nr:histidine kinase [Pedobacter nyackensis]
MKQVSFNKHWLFIFTFWLILGVTVWAQEINDFPFYSALIQSITVIISSATIAHTLSDILLPKALASGQMNHFVVQFALMTLLLSLIFTGLTMTAYWYSIKDTPLDSKKKLLTYGTFYVRLYSSVPSALLINATACGLRFYQEHNQIEKNHSLLQKEHLEAQLRILQDQINPHLMFNVLNHIHILMQKNVELASALLIKFSDILRYQLYECNQSHVLLDREVQYLKDLVAIEKIRWGEELKVESIWSIADRKRAIAPLLLVPFVENAFKHVSRLPTEKGFVNLVLKQHHHELKFKIENSNSPRPARKDNSHGLGLENVQKRLDLLYPGRHKLLIEKTDKLFIVSLTLHLEQKD